MEATTCRLRPLLNHLLIFGPSPKLRIFCFFSTSAGAKRWSFFTDKDSEKGSGSSPVYEHKLKFQRPSTIPFSKDLRKSASFIGTVEYPLQRCDTNDGSLGVHTILRVRSSLASSKYIRILLQMWDKMAEISIQHLKSNDYIYVSGHLGSYLEVDKDGNLTTRIKVIVKELNYVVQHGQGASRQDVGHSRSGDTRESILEKQRNRFRLWQLFFANPNEWTDYRKSKVKPNHPDFKHKGANEALWLSSNDPPWIRRQLELHDSRLREDGLQQHLTNYSTLTPLEYGNSFREDLT